ncbi:hypothetical protein CUC01_02915 [Akkermansia muciniphila]|nr:hypothetical protein CUB96_11635 [Akkermansia muciniphila]AYR32153.1 hypothetical protein CUC01_02915 [Akkermansia muciniphila]MCO6191453.1 hypothetical protein [Akkermansia muciniphila]MCO6193379.1 hypothetical protein [Akkermansia muciniphila]MCO6195306.1 hypothetical protein [Akkermansia muciniphila]
MSGAKGKSNYAYVGICRPFFNNKTSFVSIPLNIVLYVVLSRLFAKRPEYWGMFRHPASEKGGRNLRVKTGRQKCPLCLTMR